MNMKSEYKKVYTLLLIVAVALLFGQETFGAVSGKR